MLYDEAERTCGRNFFVLRCSGIESLGLKDNMQETLHLLMVGKVNLARIFLQ